MTSSLMVSTASAWMVEEPVLLSVRAHSEQGFWGTGGIVFTLVFVSFPTSSIRTYRNAI